MLTGFDVGQIYSVNNSKELTKTKLYLRSFEKVPQDAAKNGQMALTLV